MTRKPVIEIKNITKEFDGHIVLKGIDLTIYENEFVTLLGPSGCGKTTTLRIIGGFEQPTNGVVLIGGKDVSSLPPHKRPCNTVFQKYALFPHLNVFENVAFGLRIFQTNNHGKWAKIKAKFSRESLQDQNFDEKTIRLKVEKILKMVGLEGYGERAITQMSGGQQQRVAIARALVNEPKVLLLDEPLGALDLKLRQEMQYELKEIQRNTGITFVFVTHDQEEALTMSDKVVVMKDGEIIQIGTPEDVYNEPLSEFVANFIGESNVFDGIMIQDYEVEFDGKRFKCVDRGFANLQKIQVVIRPEDIDIVEENLGKFVGVVDSVAFKGVHFEIDVKTDQHTYLIHTTDFAPLGKKVGITFNPEDIHIMEREFDGID